MKRVWTGSAPHYLSFCICKTPEETTFKWLQWKQLAWPHVHKEISIIRAKCYKYTHLFSSALFVLLVNWILEAAMIHERLDFHPRDEKTNRPNAKRQWNRRQWWCNVFTFLRAEKIKTSKMPSCYKKKENVLGWQLLTQLNWHHTIFVVFLGGSEIGSHCPRFSELWDTSGIMKYRI